MVGTRVVPRLVMKKVIEGRMKEIKMPGRPRECYWTGWRKGECKMDYLQL